MEFKTDKFYKTRCGYKVRVYHWSPENSPELHGAVLSAGSWHQVSWDSNGTNLDIGEHFDIVREWDSIFNIDESSYKAWSSEMPIGPKPPKGFYGSDHAIDALNYIVVSETWQKKINKAFQDMAVYGTGIIQVQDCADITGTVSSNDMFIEETKTAMEDLSLEALNNAIDNHIRERLAQPTQQMCNCGGSINVHKKTCPENQELSLDELASQAANAIDLYSGLDHGESYPLGMLPKLTICECGSEKVGSSRHSEWCPKHKEF
jgi:hypothetical protein